MTDTRRFISGKYEGTRLEIMPSKAATALPDGTEIKIAPQYMLNEPQKEHLRGNINVHEPQQFILEDNGRFYQHTGPSVAQEWKILARGERPFYRFDGEVDR